MNIRRKTCWFHVLYLIGFLYCNQFINAELISPGGTFTSTYSFTPTVSSSSVTPAPSIQDYCELALDNCGPNANCSSTGDRTFNCICKEGYVGVGTYTEPCQDIDECRTIEPCPSTATCRNTAGSYQCICNSGYENPPQCIDIDECRDSTRNDCNYETSICINTAGSHTCRCKNETTANYRKNSNGVCVDVDECTESNPCGESICSNTIGSYVCGCNSGFIFDSHNLRCDDINECNNTNSSTCPDHMQCNNTIGSYNCIPDIGFKINTNPNYSYPVIDIDECVEISNVCHSNASCTNLEGSYGCTCVTGFSGDGTFCADINECNGTDECDPNANCINTVGSYTCVCKDGFSSQGSGVLTRCFDINECGNKPCLSNAECENSVGSYSCICKPGYGNAPNCTDINECLQSNNCSRNASCSNTDGSYECNCKDGFTGSGTECEDRNECDLRGFCALTAKCINTIGSFTCECATGYSGDGRNCTDNDECESNPCHQNCVNVPGSYKCSCRSGYNFVAPHNCSDINECRKNPTICQENAICINSPGSYKCQCDKGFLEDEVISADKETRTKVCIVDNFVRYDECKFAQNEDTANPSRLIQIPEGIPFSGVLQYDFYICINGFISIQFDLCYGGPSGELGGEFVNGTIFAPYLADIDLSIPTSSTPTLENRMYYCKYTHVDPNPSGNLNSVNSEIQKYVRATTNLTTYVPRNSITATWYQVVPYKSVDGSDYFNQGERATFQAVITSDGANTVVYYIYHQMQWSDDKGFPVMIGSRYNPTVSLVPQPEEPYGRLRFDKAAFTSANGKSTIGQVSFQVSDSVNVKSVRECTGWLGKQPSKESIASVYDSTFLDVSLNRRETSCPCTITQMLADFTFAMEDNEKQNYVRSCHAADMWWTERSCDELNDDDNTCFKKRNIYEVSGNFTYAIGTRCCYNSKAGSLDTSNSESGVTLNTQNHFIPLNDGTRRLLSGIAGIERLWEEAIARDIAGHRYCCLQTPLCERYEERTRVPTCSFYSPPRISTTFGDPHIMSLDGAQYTFNGLGDYWLLTTNDTTVNLTIQARTCQAVSSDGSKSPATVFCGFAFKEKGQPTFEIYHNSTGLNASYYVNGNKKPLNSSSEVDTTVIYSQEPVHQLQFIFPSGTALSVQIGKHFLQAVVTASAAIEKKTVGLLGNTNGISIDDFINRFTKNTIPVSSNEEKIYYDFGQSWKVDHDETLFSVVHSANLSSGYTPLFWTNETLRKYYNDSQIENIKEFCGDLNTNKECYFDFVITGNKDLAIDGKTLIDNSKTVLTSVGRPVPEITGPKQINVTKGVPMNFTITSISNSTNLTYFIVTNFTNTFRLLNKRTGLVNVHITGTNETVVVGVTDEFLNAGILRVKITICDCVNGECVYDAPELLANVGNVYNRITQCQCYPGYTGYRCETFLDECQLNPCFTDVTCYRHANRTSYCDPCPSGFSGDGRQCYDIDDCLLGRCEQLCHNTIGNFSCSCRSGFVPEGTYNCTDIDECQNGTVCNDEINTDCVNTEGSYKCVCKDGYRENSTRQCEDIDECIELSSGCQHNCQNIPGSYVCSCNSGTTLNADERTCNDIDECKRNDTCDPNANCTNTYGSYICECNFGYSKNGSKCQDVDECDESVRKRIGLTTACEIHCTNRIGSYECSCDITTQLSVDNHNCVQKINPCLDETKNPCDANAGCSFNMSTGKPSCTCNTGYIWNGTVCADKNECEKKDICPSNANCTDKVGSYECICNTGFRRSLDQVNCEDINECTAGTAACPTHATCSNTQGSYTCQCNSGYVKQNNLCVDVNECDVNNGDCDQVCVNKVGAPPLCSCNKGYSKDPRDSNKCIDINECVTIAPCDRNAECQNEPGTYQCTCDNGYTGNGFNCSDVNECANKSLHGCTHICNNTVGSYECSCRTGYELKLDQKTCIDINECLISGLSNCDLNKTECKNREGDYFCREKCPGSCNQRCNDTDTGYKCYCQSGYELNGKYICQDIDECKGTNDCHSSAICKNLNGTYDCSCLDGFSGDGKTPCIDIDECQTNNGGCHSNATCNNTLGSHICQCLYGFDGNGTVCVDKDECRTDSGGCHDNATCTNLVGSFGCKCKDGFSGDGKINCTDVNECLSKNGGCHVNATCINTIGSKECRCNSGFIGNGTYCDDEDECLSDNGRCHANATCTNIPGFRVCKCFPGFDGNGLNCVDRNECRTANGGCHANATCKNNVGSHTCECNGGFSGNGTACDDVDECSKNNGGCHANATCNNTIGSFLCKCYEGYNGDGRSCREINECEDNNGGCDPNAICTNTIGSRKCSCLDGFTGNGTSCENIDECKVNQNGGCHINATCIDTLGSFQCKCNSGFDGNGTNCVDRNECLKAGGGCHVNATCINKVGAHHCECNDGFSGDGQSCSNIDECLSNNGGCHTNATCTDTIGSKICKCMDGFSGNGIKCEDINNCLNTSYCHIWAKCINTIGGSDICECKDGYEGDGKNCYQIITEKVPDTIPSPSEMKRLGSSIEFFDVAVSGSVLDVKANADNLRNMSSSLSQQLKPKIELALLQYYRKIDSKVIRVVIYAFIPLGTGIQRRDTATTGQPRIQVDYAVDFNITTTTTTSEIEVNLLAEVNKTDFQVNTRDFFGKVVETSLTVEDVNPCTSTVDGLKHKCHRNAICTTTTANSYKCKCNEGYAGDGFDCKNVDTDNMLVVALVTTGVGLILLIILLIAFLHFRKKKRDGMNISSASSTSDVSWTPGVFGGMRARSMYTPAGVQPRQYTEYPPDDR